MNGVRKAGRSATEGRRAPGAVATPAVAKLAVATLAVAVAAGLAAASGLTPAAANGAETAADRLARVLGETKDAQAAFTQVRRSPLLPEPMRSEGKLWLKRPGELKLVFLDPEPMTLWKRADTTWVYVPSMAQVQRYRVESVGVPLGLALGSSRADLEASARIASDGDRVRLRPRADRPAAWSEIVVEMPPGEPFPTRLEVLQTDGERMEFRFRSVRRNTGLAAREMLPSWPDTVDVVRVGR